MAQILQHLDMTGRKQKTSLRGMRTFCAAAGHLSFRDTAESLFVTASAVSHQIRNLEQEFGQRLFNRKGSALSLTDAGQSLYDAMNPLIIQLDQVASEHRKSVSRDTLRISVQPFFASELFVPRLAEFTTANPDIDIKVDTSDESTEKHPGNVDASIRVFKSVPSNLASNRLFPLGLIPASSPEFRESLKISSSRVVSNFPRIVYENRPKAWTQWQRSAGIELPKATTSVRLDSMIAVVRAAQRGLGAALVPTRLCGMMFGSGSIVPLFDDELVTADAFYFSCGEKDVGRESVRRLRDWVVSTFVH